LTGYRGESFDPLDLRLDDGRQRGLLKLDGFRGTVDDWGAERRPDCICCNGLLGVGSVVWRRVG
jgi:hypothetical protein